ncbi:MoxR-like ATPase [Desulfotomaculum arcticum]|uniref:MoxR-like ATPase n=1 Tax=Desulfotruncus arcticus DSM 17038 TaxID=1121424 RepID=A0A1I2SYX2_9FIRM|nr:AAA family ATPase [Desulfotruncus arcticus]SFG57119.1 MoxR-like ATPase [Desulfotomaculum arcticum] [Desulfotruncus arcticus DSM 17038]
MKQNLIRNFQEHFTAMEREVGKLIMGQEEIIRHVITGIIAGGNVLLEGAPGLGKTQLVKTLARVLDLSFSRIQFTPDLMPVDIIGTVIMHKNQGELGFSFEKGPIFHSLVLADEINRATPKTQSAFLEAMQEKTVTVGATSYPLPDPFFVLATENPLEMEGTYPLPEAQLDRFMFKLKIFLPELNDLSRIMDLTVGGSREPLVKKLATGEQILQMQQIAREVPVAADVKHYALKIMLATHPEHSRLQLVKDYITCGASPRGAQSMLVAAKIRALALGRYNVSYEDIKVMAYPCLRHRIFLNFRAGADQVDADAIIEEILRQVK